MRTEVSNAHVGLSEHRLHTEESRRHFQAVNDDLDAEDQKEGFISRMLKKVFRSPKKIKVKNHRREDLNAFQHFLKEKNMPAHVADKIFLHAYHEESTHANAERVDAQSLHFKDALNHGINELKKLENPSPEVLAPFLAPIMARYFIAMNYRLIVIDFHRPFRKDYRHFIALHKRLVGLLRGNTHALKKGLHDQYNDSKNQPGDIKNSEELNHLYEVCLKHF